MTSILQRLVIQFLKWTEGGFNVLNMILKDLRISPLRNILTSISMLVGIIAMIGSVLVGTLGKEYLISVNAQIYGWVPTYSFSIMDCRFEDAAKMQNFLTKVQQLDDSIAVTLSMQENISFAPIPSSLEQRTHELLIRRAIGASRANIVTLVLGTQLIISIFVCIASILLSLLIVEGISVLLPPDSPITAPSYPIFSAVIAVITSVIVALLGGLLPAIKAAKLEPALALR